MKGDGGKENESDGGRDKSMFVVTPSSFRLVCDMQHRSSSPVPLTGIVHAIRLWHCSVTPT